MSDTVNEQEFLDDWNGSRETKAIDTPPPPPPPAVIVEPQQQQQQEQAPKPKPKLPPDISSEILIGAIDTTQTLVFNALLKRKVRSRYTPAQVAKAEKLIAQLEEKSIKKQELSDDDFDLVQGYKRLSDIHNDIPFTDEEYTTLKKPLAKLIEINGYDIPPNLAFSIAIAQVMAPRVVDAFFE